MGSIDPGRYCFGSGELAIAASTRSPVAGRRLPRIETISRIQKMPAMRLGGNEEGDTRSH